MSALIGNFMQPSQPITVCGFGIDRNTHRAQPGHQRDIEGVARVLHHPLHFPFGLSTEGTAQEYFVNLNIIVPLEFSVSIIYFLVLRLNTNLIILFMHQTLVFILFFQLIYLMI